MHALLLLLVADLGFSSGVRALDIGGRASSFTSESCAECHEQEAAEWRASRHRVSITNRIFVAGYAAEPEARCVRCHAPLPEQVAEIAKVGPDLTKLAPNAAAHEGVTCATCHVRGGEAHGNDALRSDALCGSCHEFTFHEKKRGRLILTSLPIQSTFSEWEAYRREGGADSCISCHMKDGHDIRGAHDVELLRRSLEVRVRPGTIAIASRGVGHDFPTGDVFRHITVELRVGDTWTEVARFGRKYAPRANADGSYSMRLVEDTSLSPDDVREIPLSAGAAEYRIFYRYNEDGSEAVLVDRSSI